MILVETNHPYLRVKHHTHPPSAYPYPPPEPIQSGGGDHSSGGENNSETT
jgi:hypothetical protein